MSGRRKSKVRRPCPLAATLLGQFDEVAEQAAVPLDLRPRRPRFDRQGRRLARIHTLYRPRQGTVPGEVLPMIRLSGKWLQESGFPVGTRYSVEVENGELVIRAL